jgi:hypothetical protein
LHVLIQEKDSLSLFDVKNIARLMDIYVEDFSISHRDLIRNQLQTYILHVRRVDEFKSCHDL